MRTIDNGKTIMDTKYTRVIYYSEEDECWVVVVPELAGCQADGETKEEALLNSDTIIREWIETAKSFGREIPEPKGNIVLS